MTASTLDPTQATAFTTPQLRQERRAGLVEAHDIVTATETPSTAVIAL
ncbi:hypothetical protein SAMN05192555_11223 [Franzmannia pantelleriensis]|uniref:Uncharacterized protein n=1 Tax=Franzmannia pantelleriensis TaxID=48727 RepID=A0A1G9SGP0_9GAMM|nr:hypothetical protein SAMN05192555_11223 [Halomonas pantelleriensis]